MSRPRTKSARPPARPGPSLRRRRLGEGQTVYSKGEPSAEFYRLVSGEVHLALPGRRKQTEPAALGPGAIFGQSGLFTGQKRRDSAVCATDVVVDVLDRHDALKLLDCHDEPARKLLSGLFDLAAGPEVTEPQGDELEEAVGGIQLVRLLLKPASRALGAWIGRDPIEITRLPFVVGRADNDADQDSGDGIDLALDDEKPYQLSRQHFVIDTFEGELVVRDSASYQGTVVNNLRIGRARGNNIAPLRIGENSIVAGSGDSPFCFTLSIETD